LHYTVGDCDVLETPDYTSVSGMPVFTRTFKLAASDKPLTVLLNDETKVGEGNEPVAMGVSVSPGVKEVSQGHSRRYAIFPPRKEPTTYKVSLFRTDETVPLTQFAKVMESMD